MLLPSPVLVCEIYDWWRGNLVDFLCESKCLAIHYCDMAHELTRIFDTLVRHTSLSRTHKKAHAIHLLEVMMVAVVLVAKREHKRNLITS